LFLPLLLLLLLGEAATSDKMRLGFLPFLHIHHHHLPLHLLLPFDYVRKKRFLCSSWEACEKLEEVCLCGIFEASVSLLKVASFFLSLSLFFGPFGGGFAVVWGAGLVGKVPMFLQF